MQVESLGALGLFFSAFISATVAPGASEAVLAYLIKHNSTSIYELILIATIGNTLGALTTWGLGAWASKRYPAETILSPRRQQALQTLRHYGAWALLFSWVPVVGDGFCFAGGWLKLSLYSSVIAILSGKAIRYAAVAYAFV